jgi:NADPH-dependent 2,4-dienoyl-CoA reductase/sulfur reductase-like enzyme
MSLVKATATIGGLTLISRIAGFVRDMLMAAFVGAGMAGLACADTLRVRGIRATLHEGRERVGGRVWSMGASFAGPVEFPGQVVERGGALRRDRDLVRLEPLAERVAQVAKHGRLELGDRGLTDRGVGGVVLFRERFDEIRSFEDDTATGMPRCCLTEIAEEFGLC